MLKRTKGYTLLLLLVLTGLAGRLSTTTITSKERRLIIDELKESKAVVFKTVKGLSEEQLNFKTSAGQRSIKECLQQIIVVENHLWNMADASLNKPANPDKNKEIKLTDQEAQALAYKDQKTQASKSLKAIKPPSKTTEEILDAFKNSTNDLIKFAKTSTDDMRSHILKMPTGYIDSYQMILYLSVQTRCYVKQIEKIKANPLFPK